MYVDNQLFVAGDDNYRVVHDFALAIIEGTGDTVFSVGACWHGKHRFNRNYSVISPYHVYDKNKTFPRVSLSFLSIS